MARLAKRNYKKEDQGWTHRAKRSLNNVSRVKSATIWAIAGTAIPFVGTTIGAIIGFTGKDIIKYLWKEEGVYEKLANGGMAKLRNNLQETVDSVREQWPLLQASLTNMQSRQSELIANSDDATMLSAQIQNTENLIQLYQMSVMNLIHTAPQALEHLQSAVNACNIWNTVDTIAEATSWLQNMANQSIEAAFTITAWVSERLANNLWAPLLADKTLRLAVTALGSTQANLARIANTNTPKAPSPALLALAAASKQEKPKNNQTIELPNNPE
jgi:hypothetical protein